MFDEIPVRVWLLLPIVLVAWLPVRFLSRYAVSSPARRDITQPQDDLSWRTPEALVRNLAILAALVAAAVFIFTPFAERMAKGPRFWPILTAGFGAWALYTVPRGYLLGKIEPISKGAWEEYHRDSQPKRFWAALVWNAVLGGMMMWVAYQLNEEASTEIAEDRCFGERLNSPLSVRKEACPALIASYDSALRDDPSDYNSHFNRAFAYTLLGKQQEAIAGYSDAIRVRPEDADAYFNRALLYLETMDYDLALADLDRAHELDPKSADPLAHRGVAHAWKGDTEKATSDFAAARSIDPDNLVVMRGEVFLAINIADFHLAVTRANETLARYPDDLGTLAMRADAYRRLGEFGKSRADAQRVNAIVERANRS